MFATYADNPRRCPELPLVPPECPGDLVKCCWCHDCVDKGDMTQFDNGDLVCGDCLRDYLEEVGSEYAEEFAASQKDFIEWWSTDFIGYDTRMTILGEVFKRLNPEERQKAYKEFAWASGQYFREFVEERLGGTPLV